MLVTIYPISHYGFAPLGIGIAIGFKKNGGIRKEKE